LQHDLFRVASRGFRKTFDFGGKDTRAEFWLYVLALYVLGWAILTADGLGSSPARFMPPTQDGWWVQLFEYIQRTPFLQYFYEQVMRAWPYDLTFLRDPFIRFRSTTFSLPVLVLILFLSLSAVVRRARDAGWRPWFVALLAYWHIVGTAIIVSVMFAIASMSEALAWTIGIPGTLLLSQNWMISIAAAFIALLGLTAPSSTSSIHQEVQS
jgi:uncharacterized membrane protein YhaH (DUF805 family)